MIMIYYSSVNFYATAAATSGAAPTWTGAASGTGAADSGNAACSFTGAQEGAILYVSGFAPNLNARANIASGFINIVHRQRTGTANNGTILQQYHGTGLNIPQATGNISSFASVAVSSGTYSTATAALPTSLLTPETLNDPTFFLGVRYASESTLIIDVDSVYLTLVYDVVPTPFYKAASIFRTGAGFRLK